MKDLPFDGVGLFYPKTDEILESLLKHRRQLALIHRKPAHNLLYAVLTLTDPILITRGHRHPVFRVSLVSNLLSKDLVSRPADRIGRPSRTFNTTNPPAPPPHLIRLAPFLHAWAAITSDTWVLTIVATGYATEFHSTPCAGLVRNTATSPVL